MNHSDQRIVLKAFSRTLDQEAHNLQQYPQLLWQQMYNRLQWVGGENGGGELASIIEPELHERSKTGRRTWLHSLVRLRESSGLIRTLTGHAGPVQSVAYSPGGQLIASGSHDNTVKIWDAYSGAEIVTLAVWDPETSADISRSRGGVRATAFSADGTKIVATYWDGARFWDVTSGQVTETINFACSIVLSPDGRRMLWFEIPAVLGPVPEFMHDPEWKQFASTIEQYPIGIWDAKTKKAIAWLEGKGPIAFSPECSRAISLIDGNTLALWDAETWDQVTTLKAHNNPVCICEFSPDGSRILSGSRGGTLQIWDSSTGCELSVLEDHTGCLYSAAFSPDGQHVVAAGEDLALRLWEMESAQQTGYFAGHASGHRPGFEGSYPANGVYSVAFSPDGNKIVSGGGDWTIKIWDSHAYSKMIPANGHDGWVSNIAISPDGKRVVSAGSDGFIKHWDANAGSLISTSNGGGPLAFSPDGKRLISSRHDSDPELLDAETGQVIAVLAAKNHRVGVVAFSPDGTKIASGSFDYRDLPGAGPGLFMQAALSGEPVTLIVWDSETGRALRNLSFGSSVVSLAFSPGNTRIASTGSEFAVWDAATGEKVMSLVEGSALDNSCAAFSPNGNCIVFGSWDGALTLWDALTGTKVGAIAGHLAGVRGIMWCPNGSHIVSISDDATLRFWDAEEGICVAVLPCAGRVHCCGIDASGIRTCCGDDGGNVHIFELMGGRSR